MPPPSATPGTLSSLNTQNSLEINACRWSWCRLTFLTNAELIHHVINDHVYTAIPIRRMDIPILKRAEEGIGESLSLTGFGMFAPNSNDASERLKSRKEDTSIEPTSSLPSPPASSPTSIFPAASEDERCSRPGSSISDRSRSPSSPEEGEIHPYDRRPHPGSPMSNRNSFPSSLEEGEINPYDWHSSPPAESPMVPISPCSKLNTLYTLNDAPSTPPSRRVNHHDTPTFASLSSPIDSPAQVVPSEEFPSLDDLIEQATSSNKRQAVDGRASMDTSPYSQISSSSFGSSDAVEKQLTQNVDGNDDDDLRPSKRPRMAPISSHTEPRQVPTLNLSTSTNDLPQGFVSASSPTAVTPVRVRQAWYGTVPRIRSTLPTNNPQPQGWYGALPEIRSTPRTSDSRGWYGTLPEIRSTPHTSDSQGWYGTLPEICSTPRPSHSTRSENLPGSIFHSETSYVTLQEETTFASPTNSQVNPSASSPSPSDQDGSQVFSSFPPLQTQAPYRSQSLSQ